MYKRNPKLKLESNIQWFKGFRTKLYKNTQTITSTNRITSITAYLVSFSPPFTNNPVDLYSLPSLNKSIYATNKFNYFKRIVKEKKKIYIYI